MAPPHRWYDALIDAGWHDKLSRPALQLLLAIARRVDRHRLETRASLLRLTHEAHLSRTNFFAGKAELIRLGLVEQSKLLGRRGPVLRLNPLVPASANRELDDPQARDSGVPETGTSRSPKCGLIDGRDPPRVPVSARRHQKTKEQLEEKTEEKTMRASDGRYHVDEDLPSSATCWDDTWSPQDALTAAAATIRALPDDEVRSVAVGDAAFVIAHKLQASGIRRRDGELWWSGAVLELLSGALRAAVAP